MGIAARYGHPIHGDCANFRNGFCKLKSIAVDPNGAACPEFTPKRKMKTLQPQSQRLEELEKQLEGVRGRLERLRGGKRSRARSG